MSELKHEAIVRVLSAQEEDAGWHYFVMEYLPGGDLRRAVIDKQLRPDHVVYLMLRVCGAVALAHSRNIIHRDIKPANILLTATNEPKLTDFDLVAHPETTGGTRTGAMGTFVYSAPEALDRPMDAGPPSDVYSLGMTTVFAFNGGDLPILAIRDIKLVIRDLPISPPIAFVLDRATDYGDPTMRFPDARSFGEGLIAAVRASGNKVYVPPRDRPKSSYLSRIALYGLGIKMYRGGHLTVFSPKEAHGLVAQMVHSPVSDAFVAVLEFAGLSMALGGTTMLVTSILFADQADQLIVNAIRLMVFLVGGRILLTRLRARIPGWVGVVSLATGLLIVIGMIYVFDGIFGSQATAVETLCLVTGVVFVAFSHAVMGRIRRVYQVSPGASSRTER